MRNVSYFYDIRVHNIHFILILSIKKTMWNESFSAEKKKGTLLKFLSILSLFIIIFEIVKLIFSDYI